MNRRGTLPREAVWSIRRVGIGESKRKSRLIGSPCFFLRKTQKLPESRTLSRRCRRRRTARLALPRGDDRAEFRRMSLPATLWAVAFQWPKPIGVFLNPCRKTSPHTRQPRAVRQIWRPPPAVCAINASSWLITFDNHDPRFRDRHT